MALSLLLGACTSLPQSPSAPRATAATRAVATFSLSGEDAAAIRAYYGSDRGRGNGRGRNGGLPPGIEKNLARGKPLPPGIAKQYLPPDLLRRLPPPERGMEYVVVAGKLLLVEIATQVVRDILLDAVFD
jgi:Ni/Co efflux regulator RcnB